jgi:hypothetical protein
MKQADGRRSWLKQAHELGKIRTIEGADWDLEIGIADIVNEPGSDRTSYSENSPRKHGRRLLELIKQLSVSLLALLCCIGPLHAVVREVHKRWEP